MIPLGYDEIVASAAFLREKTAGFEPEIGLILGTGLGHLADAIKAEYVIPYGEIPHFPVSTVQSHAGQLMFGTLSGKRVVAMQGRFHYYEGYSMQQITFPVRVMRMLGAHSLFISSAVGSTNANIEAGDVVFVRDHINLMGNNPLRGANDDRLGPRFPDMLKTYDADLIHMAYELSHEHAIRAHKGVYVAFAGPNLETPAEYEYLNRIGGDVVGMSTVPEVLVAKHAGMKIFVAAVVANKSFPIDEIKEVSVDDVIKTVGHVSPKLSNLLQALLLRL